MVDADDDPRLVGNTVHDNAGSGIVVMRGLAALSENSITGNRIGLPLSMGVALAPTPSATTSRT